MILQNRFCNVYHVTPPTLSGIPPTTSGGNVPKLLFLPQNVIVFERISLC